MEDGEGSQDVLHDDGTCPVGPQEGRRPFRVFAHVPLRPGRPRLWVGHKWAFRPRGEVGRGGPDSPLESFRYWEGVGPEARGEWSMVSLPGVSTLLSAGCLALGTPLSPTILSACRGAPRPRGVGLLCKVSVVQGRGPRLRLRPKTTHNPGEGGWVVDVQHMNTGVWDASH